MFLLFFSYLLTFCRKWHLCKFLILGDLSTYLFGLVFPCPTWYEALLRYECLVTFFSNACWIWLVYKRIAHNFVFFLADSCSPWNSVLETCAHCLYFRHFRRNSTLRSSHQRCSIRKGLLRNFAKFTGTCAKVSFLIKLQEKKETLARVFSCEFCEISKNTFFTEHLWLTVSKHCCISAFFAATDFHFCG